MQAAKSDNDATGVWQQPGRNKEMESYSGLNRGTEKAKLLLTGVSPQLIYLSVEPHIICVTIDSFMPLPTMSIRKLDRIMELQRIKRSNC